MNWKIFIAALATSFCICFPYNMIGCAGGDMDPYDYYTSFFHKNVSGNNGYEPFYYTNLQLLYGEEEPVNTAGITSAEWTRLGAPAFSSKDAFQFLCKYDRKDLSTLYYHLEKNQPLKIPDSVKVNGMTNYFLSTKNLEALGYILYAKQVEPYVTGSWNDWESIKRDSVAMNKFIKNGQQLLAAAKNDFIKLRYAYQIVRLARYSGRLEDCIKWYDELVKPNPTQSVLHDLSLSLKAGAQLYTGNKNEAAYHFSQLFAKSELKRISNYLSFSWAADRFDAGSRKTALLLCKNKTEKANMLGLFALGSNVNELPTLIEVYQLTPDAKVLPILVTREINKLEEYLFTPSLQFKQGKSKTFVNYTEIAPTSKEFKAWQEECRLLVEFCRKAASVSRDRIFYLLAAAHAAMISGDHSAARQMLEESKKTSLSPLQKDQWTMTNLLVSINSKNVIDAAFEKELLPSVQWLSKKAASDQEFAKFYRRLFADILSTKYKTSNDKNKIKYILCVGVADRIHENFVKDGWGYFTHALSQLRDEVPAQDAVELARLMESRQLNDFEKFLLKESSFNKEDVNDVIGTAWLRQHNFVEAENWFKKIPEAYYAGEPFTSYLAANPFADLLMDGHAPTSQDTVKYTKLSFAKKMIRLQKELEATSDKERKAKIHYEMAKGYYHMSYWGNSWLLVQYEWSGSEADYPRENRVNQPNSEYYKVNKAKSGYLAALANTTDKNFQARCLFMAAKCDQKQAGEIPWDQNERKVWIRNFDARNKYYTQLHTNFNSTSFYKEAFNSCSYLRDFVQKK